MGITYVPKFLIGIDGFSSIAIESITSTFNPSNQATKKITIFGIHSLIHHTYILICYVTIKLKSFFQIQHA